MTLWTQTRYPVAPWDTPGLPPRRLHQRCATHAQCAYRDDDPNRCPRCHRNSPPECHHTSDPPNVGLPAAAAAKTTPPRWPGNYGQCAKCGDEWTGLAVAHCPTCHRTFTTATALDKHRTGSHPADTRRCLDPAAAGLVPVSRGTWSGWGYPQDPRFGDDDKSA